MKAQKAFTLVELLIATAIFSVVAVTVYSAFQAGIFGFRDIGQNIDIHQSARQILERIDTDLRNSFVYSEDKESKFSGDETEMSFLTLVDTFSKDKIVEDYCLISYRLEGDTLMRACRRNQESLNPKSEIKPEEMASNIDRIKFSYGYLNPTDKALEFKDSWGGQGLPEEDKAKPLAVKVTLGIKDRAIQEFQRTIYLPLAK